jgi:hypothetical protein
VVSAFNKTRLGGSDATFVRRLLSEPSVGFDVSRFAFAGHARKRKLDAVVSQRHLPVL